jgi:hypothetical protein
LAGLRLAAGFFFAAALRFAGAFFFAGITYRVLNPLPHATIHTVGALLCRALRFAFTVRFSTAHAKPRALRVLHSTVRMVECQKKF